MRLSYGTQIGYSPIRLSMGSIIKPKLKDIDSEDMSFEQLYFYEFLAVMTPEEYFTKVRGDEGKKQWESLNDEYKSELSVFDIIASDQALQQSFLALFNFFFKETVLYSDGYFVTLNPDKSYNMPSDIEKSDIVGVITKENFSEVLNVICQICCIDVEVEKEPPKFKNKAAERIFKKIEKAESKKKKTANKNLTLPNIISSVTTKHNSINFTNVWGYTIFQLLDNFYRLQTEDIHQIDCTRVSVWGDEKKTFDPARWYKNEYDKDEP